MSPKRSQPNRSRFQRAWVKSIAERTRRFRERGGITQRQLALRAGCSVSKISRIERGVVDVSFRTLEILTDALDLSTHLYLIAGIAPKRERLMIDAMSQLSEGQIAQFGKVLEQLEASPDPSSRPRRAFRRRER